MDRQDSFVQFFSSRSVVMDASQFVGEDPKCSVLQRERRVWQAELPRMYVESFRCDALPDFSVRLPVSVDEKAILEGMFPNTMDFPYFRVGPSVWKMTHDMQPLRIGVILSGGQAAGGHNVIAGLYAFMKRWNSQSQTIGFLNGPGGLFKGDYKEITEDLLDKYRNLGGFDIIGSGRDKIETEEQMRRSLEVCKKLDLHGVVIVGGDDSNTNAAILAEYFSKNDCWTRIIGVPKTIDGDLRNQFIEASFGFDTACKVYSELVGNLCSDVASSQDRYHFVRVMGRSASHIALECALQTRPNLTLIGEEIKANNASLQSICDQITDMIFARHQIGKEYGIIIVPEGLVEFIPELGSLITELNDVLAALADASSPVSGAPTSEELGAPTFFRTVASKLSENNRALFESLPPEISNQLLLDRDAHGNVQVGRIPTEKLLIQLVEEALRKRNYQGRFIPTGHYFGYEGRCAIPSLFDANYCYALGYTAGLLVQQGKTSCMAVVRNLRAPPSEWTAGGCPLVNMMCIERRKGKNVPVIRKYLVDLEGPLFKAFESVRDNWKLKDLYRNPGPIQFEGPCANATNYTIQMPTEEDLLPCLQNSSSAHFPKSLGVLSPLQIERLSYRVPVASILRDPKTRAAMAKKCETTDTQQQERYIRRAYPLQCENHSLKAYSIDSVLPASQPWTDLKVGVVLLGQAVPGTSNVVHGLFERLTLVGGRLIGFKGLNGLLARDYIHVERDEVAMYVNQGGFEMLGKSTKNRDAIRKDENMAVIANNCQSLQLSGLVIIGGKHSLTDATNLTEHFLTNNVATRVVAVPACAENNLRHPLVEHSIGFDSTSKSYANLVGNILTDVASNKKYWYFIRLMGNVTSHIVLETALQTHPNVVIISEKYVAGNATLSNVVSDIADAVARRAQQGKNYGVVLIPEGLLTSIPQMGSLLSEVDTIWKNIKSPQEQRQFCQGIVDDDASKLPEMTPWSAALLRTLPLFFRQQLTKQTPTGRLEVSQLSVENLIALWVQRELTTRQQPVKTFNSLTHYFGYQARSTMPTDFDCALATAHGYLASILVESDLTGFATSVRGLCGKPTDWRFTAVPLAALTRLMPDAEQNLYGRKVPIIPPYEVDLNGSPFKTLTEASENWELDDLYCNPGPIQFFASNHDHYNRTLFEEQYEYMTMIEKLDCLTGYVGSVCSFGVKRETLHTAVTYLEALVDIILSNTNKTKATSLNKLSLEDVRHSLN